MDEAQLLVEALRMAAATVATAESLTGGMLGQEITAVSGSSLVYRGGIISYCNAVKQQLLDVSAQDLAKLGAVSAPVARQMALGVRQQLGTDFSMATTGIAGPHSDETGKPVGLVYIACAGPDFCQIQQLHLQGSRQEIRVATCRAALRLLLAQLPHPGEAK